METKNSSYTRSLWIGILCLTCLSGSIFAGRGKNRPPSPLAQSTLADECEENVSTPSSSLPEDPSLSTEGLQNPNELGQVELKGLIIRISINNPFPNNVTMQKIYKKIEPSNGRSRPIIFKTIIRPDLKPLEQMRQLLEVRKKLFKLTTVRFIDTTTKALIGTITDEGLTKPNITIQLQPVPPKSPLSPKDLPKALPRIKPGFHVSPTYGCTTSRPSSPSVISPQIQSPSTSLPPRSTPSSRSTPYHHTPRMPSSNNLNDVQRSADLTTLPTEKPYEL